MSDRRAENQEAAMVEAFVEGTLPASDRRVTSALAALPVGSRVSWEKTVDGEKWTVYRGAGITAHGDGPTLERAIRMVGASYGPNAEGKTVLFDETGEEIEPLTAD